MASVSKMMKMLAASALVGQVCSLKLKEGREDAGADTRLQRVEASDGELFPCHLFKSQVRCGGYSGTVTNLRVHGLTCNEAVIKLGLPATRANCHSGECFDGASETTAKAVMQDICHPRGAYLSR